MKKIEDILAQCVDDIEAGKYSIEDCLERYPSVRHELEPLLRVALDIPELPDVKPSESFKIRARVNLMEHIHTGKKGKKAQIPVLRAGSRLSWHTRWVRATSIALAVVVSIFALGTGTAYASQSSIPGDTLYTVKLGTEQIQRVLTVDEVKKVELELKFAHTRIEEIESLINTRPARLADAVAGYEKTLDLAVNEAKQVQDSNISMDMLEIIVFDISDHISLLEDIEENHPGETGNSIDNAISIAINGHMKALRIIAEEDPLRATRINLEAMQRRLQRAQDESDRGNIRQVERALQQFERLRMFGEELSGTGKTNGSNTREIDELNARAAKGHLEIMGNIYGMVPEETKSTIEESIDTSVQDYGKAVKGLQQEGAPDDLPEDPPLPPELPEEVQERIMESGPKGSGNGGK